MNDEERKSHAYRFCTYVLDDVRTLARACRDATGGSGGWADLLDEAAENIETVLREIDNLKWRQRDG